jgi:HK97 family phage major capsid protein
MAEELKMTPELLAAAKAILEAEKRGETPPKVEGLERKQPDKVAAIEPEKALEREPQATFAAPAVHPKPAREMKDFSIAKAIRGIAMGNWKDADMERDYIKRTLHMGDDTSGGFLVPEETATSIIDMLKAASVMRQAGATVIPNCPQSFNLPAQSGATTAYWVGTSELLSPVTPSDVAFKQLRIELKRVAALTKIDWDLLKHSFTGVEAIVRKDIAEQIALKEDLAFFRGAGGTEPLGIESFPGANLTTSVGAIDVDKFFDALNAIENRNGTMSGWIMHPTLWNVARKLKTGVAEYIMQPDIKTAPYSQILGMPVFKTTALATSTIYAGNWSDYVIAEGGSLEIHVLPERYADYLQTGVLAVHRVDGIPRRTETIQILTGCS